jgi:hypothetical protein
MSAWTKALSMTRLRLEADHCKAPTPLRHCRVARRMGPTGCSHGKTANRSKLAYMETMSHRQARTWASLTSHSLVAAPGSFAPWGTSRGFMSKKYPPLCSATSGASAKKTSVSAPLAGERENGLVRAMPKLISTPLLWLKLVATLPGW